jgi:PKD repeat protein
VAASASASGTLDFGDGTPVVDFVIDSGIRVTLKHTYTRNGTFVVTLTATDGAGQSVSLPTTIMVR